MYPVSKCEWVSNSLASNPPINFINSSPSKAVPCQGRERETKERESARERERARERESERKRERERERERERSSNGSAWKPSCNFINSSKPSHATSSIHLSPILRRALFLFYPSLNFINSSPSNTVSCYLYAEYMRNTCGRCAKYTQNGQSTFFSLPVQRRPLFVFCKPADASSSVSV
jgi:hypothetical protein